MRYFRHPESQDVYAYDPEDQQDYIDKVVAEKWEEVTGSWPPPPVEPEPPKELTPQEKLANAGLTVDELKSLLGL